MLASLAVLHVPYARALTVVLPCLVAGGCTPLERVGECKRLVQAVNSDVSEVRFALPDAGADAAAYTEIAGIYDRLGQRVSELAPGDPSLSRTLVSYREILTRAAENSRSYAEALGQPAANKQQRKERESRLKRIRVQAKGELVREASVVRKLNSLCHPE